MKIIVECVPKTIGQIEDERNKMKQKQIWLTWKIKSALPKEMIAV